MFTTIKDLLAKRPVYAFRDENFWQENRWLLLASLLTFIVVVVWRSWPHYINPNLYVEDNTHYFNYFYGNVRDYSALFHNTNGYINILNNLIAKWVAFADVRIQPFLYTYIGTAIAVLASVSLSFSGIFKNKYIIFIAPFLLGLMGMNHIFYYITLTYQIYILVILLLTLLFWEPVKNNVLNFLFFILLSLLIWSGPYSVLTVPAAGCFILFFRGREKQMIGLIIVAISYTMSVNESTIWLHNILNDDIRQLWRHLLVERVMFMDLAGPYSSAQLLVVGLMTVSVLWYFRKDSFYLKIAFILFGLMNGGLAALLLSKKIALYQRILPCHLVIAQFLWMALVLFTIDRFLVRNRQKCYLGLVAFVLLGSLIVYDNVQKPDKRKIAVMTNLSQFLEEVHKAEQRVANGENMQIDLQYGNKLFRPHVKVGVEEKNAETVIENIHIK